MIPAARQRVRVVGHDGVFFVLTVNQDVGYADLVELGSATLFEAVLLERILPFHHEVEHGEPVWSLERKIGP